MIDITYKWTDGKNEDFKKFYLLTEEYYSKIVGGKKNRLGFVPYNLSEDIDDVIIAYDGGKAVACAGLKEYSRSDAEIKRVWVQPEYRGKGIATKLMVAVEEKARCMGFERAVLQTREIMTDAVALYEKLGYSRIENYPPYDKLDGAVCFAKRLARGKI